MLYLIASLQLQELSYFNLYRINNLNLMTFFETVFGGGSSNLSAHLGTTVILM